jgi:hypothetical protein
MLYCDDINYVYFLIHKYSHSDISITLFLIKHILFLILIKIKLLNINIKT